MKTAFKFLFALITGVYLLNNIGVPVYYHYCGGELESVSAVFKADACCEGMEEEEDSDCCKNEVKIIAQFNDSYSEVSLLKVNCPSCSNYPLLAEFISPITVKENSFVSSDYHSDKPPTSGRDILDFKSVLII